MTYRTRQYSENQRHIIRPCRSSKAETEGQCPRLDQLDKQAIISLAEQKKKVKKERKMKNGITWFYISGLKMYAVDYIGAYFNG